MSVCGFLIESFGAPSWLDHKQKLMLLRQTATPDRHFGGNKLESKLIPGQSEMQTKEEWERMRKKERERQHNVPQAVQILSTSSATNLWTNNF